MTPTARKPRPDAVLLTAVDSAHSVLTSSVEPADVGPHTASVAEGDRLVTHTFECLRPGYRGWHWSVVVTRAARQRTVTVDEVVLLPGPDAIVAPTWVPYRDRVQAADLGPGDLLLSDEDDARLVPTWLAGDERTEELIDERSIRQVADDLGLGRVHMLSLEGRDAAVQRWYDGDHGPETALARSAPAHCHSCGFLVRLAGPLSTVFGVCANAMAPDDGQVVSFDHGCGAHSEVALTKAQLPPMLPPPVFDTVAFDDIELF
ncbi:MAG: DUF3027 domain-containing protein [Nocardioidaceae bacterium]